MLSRDLQINIVWVNEVDVTEFRIASTIKEPRKSICLGLSEHTPNRNEDSLFY